MSNPNQTGIPAAALKDLFMEIPQSHSGSILVAVGRNDDALEDTMNGKKNGQHKATESVVRKDGPTLEESFMLHIEVPIASENGSFEKKICDLAYDEQGYVYAELPDGTNCRMRNEDGTQVRLPIDKKRGIATIDSLMEN